MKLRFVDPRVDRWHAPGGDDGPPVHIRATPWLLLDLAGWHAARADWPAGVPVGVSLANDADPAQLAPDLGRLALVQLAFPKWTDGRAYSQARLLRQRHGYAGELRAAGDVIADMAPLLARNGFDSAWLRGDQRVEVAERALRAFERFYQGDAAGLRPPYATDAPPS